MAERALGLGLRGQIMLILSAAFMISFTALGALVIEHEGGAARRLTQARTSAALYTLTAASAEGLSAEEAEAAIARLVGRLGIVGAELARNDNSTFGVGRREGAAGGSVQLAGGEQVRLWSVGEERGAGQPLMRLLLGYLGVTGSFVLLLAFVALTRLIVRPVARLTDAAETLEAGRLDTRVEVAGAREVSGLAVSFNRMARQLKADRDDLAEKIRALERTTRELELVQEQVVRSEKLASVGRLSAGLAHEIGNPLAAILGLVELLRTGELSASEQAEFLARIHAETERIHRILRDLLDFARQRTQAPQAEAESDLTRVVDDALKLISPQADVRRISIQRRIHDAPLPTVRGEEHELSQVVLNLLLNAVDAVSGEGEIVLDLRADAEAVVLSIADSGAGIPESLKATLFEPFVTTKPEGKGTGLGLAVCQGIVARLGGTITAENRPTRGAVFHVRLPRYAAGAVPPRPARHR